MSTNQGSVPRLRSVTSSAMLSGVWPGTWSTCSATLPIRISRPCSTGSWGKAALAAGWMWIRAPVLPASAWLPDTWSACTWVSRMALTVRPLRRAIAT